MLFFIFISYTFIGDFMFNRINNFIKDNELEINIYNDYIHIKNYLRLISLENNYISLTTNNKKLLIKGTNLSLKKILDQELLITGEFNSIEVINE